MSYSLLVGIALISSSSFQTPKTPLPQPGLGTWKKSTLKPNELAAKASAAVKSMNRIGGVFESTFTTAKGQARLLGLIRVNDKTHYRIDSVYHAEEPYIVSMVADGSKRQVKRDMKVLPAMSLNTQVDAAKIPPKDYFKQFFIDFSRLSFQGFTDNVDAWGPIVSSFNAPSSGFKTRIEERKLKVNGKEMIHYRFVGERTPDVAKKFGAANFEVRFDSRSWLPVTIRTNWKDAKGKTWSAQWAGAYGKIQKPFTPDQLKLSAPLMEPR